MAGIEGYLQLLKISEETIYRIDSFLRINKYTAQAKYLAGKAFA